MTVAAVITPARISDGDPVVLAALCERAGASVMAYCRQVVGSEDDALHAATEAFSSFRTALIADPQITGEAAMALLRDAVRKAAAQRGANVLAARGGQVPDGCPGPESEVLRHVVNELTPAQHERVVAHLAECGACADAEQRLRAAENVLVQPPDITLASSDVQVLVQALALAAPVHADGRSQLTVSEEALGLLAVPPIANDPDPAQQPEAGATGPSTIDFPTVPAFEDGGGETASDLTAPSGSGRLFGRLVARGSRPRPGPPSAPRERRSSVLQWTARVAAIVVVAVAGMLLGAGIIGWLGDDGGEPKPLAGAGVGSTENPAGGGASDGKAAPVESSRANVEVKVLSAIVHPVADTAADGIQRARLGVHVRVEAVGGRTLGSSRPQLLVGEDRVKPVPESRDDASMLAKARSGVTDVTLRFDVEGPTVSALTQKSVRLRVSNLSVALRPKLGTPVASG